jgi:hypothetical protein
MTRLRTPSRPPPSKLEEATVRAIYRTFLGGAVLTVAALAALLIVSGGWQPVGAAVAILGGLVFGLSFITLAAAGERPRSTRPSWAARAAGLDIPRMLDARGPVVVSLRTALSDAAPGVSESRGYSDGGSEKSRRRPDDNDAPQHQYSGHAHLGRRG